jgi:mRNA deadenylase 3'-5' endonuclease subunit Ccr4
MQEVDKDKVESFWSPMLKKKVGLDKTIFTTFPDGKKNHGQIIAFSTDTFELHQHSFISYDDVQFSDAESQTLSTRNTGMLLSLKFNNPGSGGSLPCTPGLIVGTTHMFWHPMVSVEA